MLTLTAGDLAILIPATKAHADKVWDATPAAVELTEYRKVADLVERLEAATVSVEVAS